MKKKVFISYSRRDMDFIKTLAEDLEKENFDVWYDLTDIDAGDRWAKEIQKGINESEIFAIVVSPNSLKSDWVEKEFLFASKRGLKIVPLLYEMCELPIWLMNIQYVDIVGRNYKKNFPQILDAFNGYGRRSEDEEKASEKNKLRELFEKKKIPQIVGAVIGVAAIFWIISKFMPPVVPVTPTLETPIAVPTGTNTATVVPPTATSTLTPTARVEFTPSPLPDVIVDDKTGVEMVLIPFGSFSMGNNRSEYNAKPVHTVVLDSFYMDKYEVTNAQYKACVDEAESPCILPATPEAYLEPRNNNHPVVYINWDMAVAYCEWRGARLPTEAEWEKAARDGKYADYPWGNDKVDGKKLNFCDMNCDNSWKEMNVSDKYTEISPVGNYEDGKTDSGIYDLAGNVWEWVADWYGANYYATSHPTITKPSGPETGTHRVLRGGSWYDQATKVLVYKRYHLNPVESFSYVGFRCAADVPAE